MLNQKILEAVYQHGPCNYDDLMRHTGVDYMPDLAFTAIELMMGGLVEFDRNTFVYSYAEDAWLP